MNKFLLSFLMILGSSIYCVAQNTAANNWSIIEDTQYAIEYPNEWKIDRSGQSGSRFILFSKPTSTVDTFRENVNLIIQDLTGKNIDLIDFATLSENQIRSQLSPDAISFSQQLQANDLSYHKLIYKGRQGNFDLQFEQYYWVENEKAFVLTLTCEEKEFEKFQQIGEKILNSFRIKLSNN